jgi:hypothetical protein
VYFIKPSAGPDGKSTVGTPERVWAKPICPGDIDP